MSIRTYQKKFSEEGYHYDFDNVDKLDLHLDEDFTILKGFTKEGKYGKQVTMLIEKEDGTLKTVQTGSAVIVKQFEEEKKEGFPVKVKVITVQSQSTGNTYLTFTSPDEE